MMSAAQPISRTELRSDPAPWFDLAQVVTELHERRQAWRTARQRSLEPGGRELPSRSALVEIVDALRGVLFPMRLGPSDLRQENEDYYVGHTLDTALQRLLVQVRLELQDRQRLQAQSRLGAQELDGLALHIVREFAHALPQIRGLLDQDVLAAFEGDPAAHSVDEVLLCYPGIQAMIHHRLAHQLYRLGVPMLARLVAELSHERSGIDVHPGARIGPGFFIDHGTGVVIGETCEIGQRVRIYQAVTLGARSFPVDEHGHALKGRPRHPIVEDDVVIYAGATILGRITIGQGATIGGNVWITHDVPPRSHVTQAVARQEVIAA